MKCGFKIKFLLFWCLGTSSISILIQGWKLALTSTWLYLVWWINIVNDQGSVLGVLVGCFELSGFGFFSFRLSRKMWKLQPWRYSKIDWTRSWASLLCLVLLGLEHWTQWPSGDHSTKLCCNSMTLTVNHKIRWAITASLCKEGQTIFLTEIYFTQFSQGKTEPL